MALPKRSRIAKARDFQAVFRRSRRVEGALLTLRVHRKASSPGRAAVVVSNKVSKRAVLRNRIRRRIVEWLRQEASLARSPVDLIVSVKPPALLAPRRALLAELARLTQSLNIS